MGAFLEKNKMATSFACILLISVLILSKLLYDAYQNYSKTIITQQQQHLLSISSTVSNNLSLYISGELEKLEVLTESQGFQEEYQKYYNGKQIEGLRRYILGYMYRQGLSRVYILDKDLSIILKYDPKPLPERFRDDFLWSEPLIMEGNSGVGDIFHISRHHIAMPMVHSIYIEGRYMGAVVGVVDLQNVYNAMVAPVAVGQAGFVTVADRNGTVIMHPAEERVGTNYFANPIMKTGYFEEQQQMRREQYTNVSGTGMFKTVWWLSPYAPKVVLIMGYSRAQAGENFWVVSAVMDLEEAMAVSHSNVPKMAAFSVALIALFVAGFATFWQMHRNRQELILETRNLKVLNSALEDLNKSREQLMHYQKLQTIGNFANGIAHEFNNLLTPILGLSELLREDLKNQPQALEDVKAIHQSGVRARELISQILTFGRKGLDKESFAILPFHILVEDILRMLRAILPPSIELVLDLKHGDSCCLGNQAQLHQVVLNLCSNAYQAMEKSGGTLTLKTRLTPAGDLPPVMDAKGCERFIEFSVIDTGIGIEAGELEQIFDPYFTTKESGKGTGLGLAVARGIVEGHDGYIDAQSVPGKGSTFRVFLPDVPPSFPPSTDAVVSQPHPNKPSSILLIDSAEDIAKAMTRLLDKVGYRVQAHTDPIKAVDIFERNYRSFDLIIIICGLPDLNEHEVAQKVKSLRRDIPIILVTSHTDFETEDSGRFFACVMRKPLDFGLFCEAVENALREPRKARK